MENIVIANPTFCVGCGTKGTRIEQSVKVERSLLKGCRRKTLIAITAKLGF